MLLGELITKNAMMYPRKKAVVRGAIKYTFTEFNRRVNSLTNALFELGINKGDRVAVLADDCPQYVEIYGAGAKGGMVIVPLNVRLTKKDYVYIINNSGANTLIAGENYWGIISSIRPELDVVEHFIILGEGPPEGAKSYESLVQAYPPNEPDTKLEEEDLLAIMYTSGTTGLPKGVMYTQRHVIATSLATVIGSRMGTEDIVLTLFPLSSSFGATIMTAGIYVGATHVIARGGIPKGILEVIEGERVSSLWLPPALLMALLEYPEISRYNLRSLTGINYGGSAIPMEMLKKAIKVFGNVFTQFYGSTEYAPMTSLAREDHVLEGPEERLKRLSSCGRAAVNTIVRVVDEDGNDVPPGEMGEIVARGDIMMKGYWRAPEVTAETIRGGYLYSGDLGLIDEEGYLYVAGRKTDMITVGEEKVYAKEVEEVLYAHQSIIEAAVIGVPDEQLGESMKAVVVLRGGEQVAEQEIIEFCKQSLPDYATPRSVEFAESLPRNPTGKVLKRVLKERYGGEG